MRKPRYLQPISDAEEARIQAGIANDPDNPELTDEELAALRPAREVLPPELYAALMRHRPVAQAAQGGATEEVTIALDRAVLEHFRADGPEWQTRINEALKQVIGSAPAASGRSQSK
jgi:uncharacterized protein (DUF4415 family)